MSEQQPGYPLDETYNLFPYFVPYLDPHMILPVLEFLQQKDIYALEDILQAKYDVLVKANMVDFTSEVYNELQAARGQEPSKEIVDGLAKKRTQVFATMQDLKAKCHNLIEAFKNESVEILRKKRREEIWEFLKTNCKVELTYHLVETLYKYARFFYEIGNYSFAAEYLRFYRLITTNEENSVHAMWGILASDILMQQWDAALEDIQVVKEYIDKVSDPLSSVQQKVWLLHWSLFVFFNHPNGRTNLAELMLTDKYMNVIQSNCPYMLRYFTVSIITIKRKRQFLKDLVRVLNQEAHIYSDPVTQFFLELQSNFNFDEAQKRLKESDILLSNDFLLCNIKDEFMESAKQFVFETFCRIHQRVNIDMLAEKLGLEKDKAEKWIVDMIRTARIDAKIDSEQNCVVMMNAIHPQNPYQQIIEKTRELVLRTNNIDYNLGLIGRNQPHFRQFQTHRQPHRS